MRSASCDCIVVVIHTPLVAMNYPFTGDVIAGSVLGALIAVWGVYRCRLRDETPAR